MVGLATVGIWSLVRGGPGGPGGDSFRDFKKGYYRIRETVVLWLGFEHTANSPVRWNILVLLACRVLVTVQLILKLELYHGNKLLSHISSHCPNIKEPL